MIWSRRRSLRLGLWRGWRDREGSLCILSFRLAGDREGFILDLQASRIAVARALLVEFHTASAGRQFKRAFLFRLSAVLTARGWFASVNHIEE
jgi:hypothetical protein